MDMFSNPTSGCALSLAITPTPLAADFDLQPPSSLTSLCQPTCRPPCTKHPPGCSTQPRSHRNFHRPLYFCAPIASRRP
ncbi:hypothetical protein B0H10DRAFT_771152 [Mycena sp. CBHHK59/15]|nr:hypothetical protein B0H10DRAFT_771152 [Mycena sp. CBHHK59/15]